MLIVHGLERKHISRSDVLYLHVGEARTSKAREWTGLVAEPTLTTGLEELLTRLSPRPIT